MVEVEAHHLRAHQGEVILLRQRETRGVDRAESREPAGQGAGLRRHCLGSVVRHSLDVRRSLELAPLTEERGEIVPGAGGRDGVDCGQRQQQ